MTGAPSRRWFVERASRFASSAWLRDSIRENAAHFQAMTPMIQRTTPER
jgi:hypothetical protein